MRVCLLTGPASTTNHLHRAAATLDAEAEVSVPTPVKDWAKLLDLPADTRPDLIAIAGPADAHTLRALTSAGYHLLLEPPALTPEEAEDLARTAKQSGSIITVAWHDTAYPMARAAMALLRDRKLGAIHTVAIEHHRPRGPSQPITHAISALAPAAENLLSTLTGLKLRALCAESALNASTRAYDDAHILLRFETPTPHTRGHMTLSRTAPHHELAIRLHAEQGALAWSSRTPAVLHLTYAGKPTQVLTAADADSGPFAAEAARNPAQPEGAVEALANLYRAAYESIRAKREGRARKALGREFPTTADLTRAARFTAAALDSARAGGVWAEL